MLRRLLTLIRKELQLALRDPRSRQLLILPIILQLALFPFAATLEVKNATLAIFNQDPGVASRELVQRLAVTRAFPTRIFVTSQAELQQVIDTQQALIGVEFPPDFSAALAAGRPAKVLAVIDGRRSNSAQIALGYASNIIQAYGDERAVATGRAAASRIVIRHWFNPNLEYQWFMLPTLVAIIATLGSLIVTALSVAREREQGTLEQLLVSPLTPGLIMIGKTIPAVLIAVAQASVISLAAVVIYRVPFHGSIPMLYVSMVCYALSLAGFGLFISALCDTQQQAFLGVFSFMVPAIMLSGFISPVENMPLFFRGLSWIDPLSHFIVIVKGIFLKGYRAADIWPNLWPLLVLALFTTTAGYWMFRRRIA
jgi:ABC-2 type transport system permease protein